MKWVKSGSNLYSSILLKSEPIFVCVNTSQYKIKYNANIVKTNALSFSGEPNILRHGLVISGGCFRKYVATEGSHS